MSSDVSSVLGSLADSLGTTEAALRLLISLFLGYPFALVHWHYVSSWPPAVQNAYFAISGFLIGLFNFGWEIAHCFVCIAVQYAALVAFGRRRAAPFVSMVFQMSYLLLGYWCTESENYDIRWTLPHCVLTLRLIGVAFDYYDGRKAPDELSKEQKLTALRERPSLLELCGHALFPTAVMVGPQFPMKRYKFLVSGDLRKLKDFNGNDIAPPLSVALGRLGLGMFYTAVYIVGSSYFPVNYGVSREFLGQSFLMRCLLGALWVKIHIYKYLSCWLITEGACILSGLSYNGVDERGASKWDGSRNIHVLAYETATEYQQMIGCFNTNTNAWVSNYVFKRLKFLGNKDVSHFAALLFLAVWHGLHFGYYVAFFNEFLIVTRERDFYRILNESPVYNGWFSKPWVQLVFRPFKMVWMWVGLSYSAMPFLLLKTRRWWRCYVSLYFHIHILFLSYPLLKPYLKKWLGVRSPAKKDDLHQNGLSKILDERKKISSNCLDMESNGVHLRSESVDDKKKID